jgi:alkanesulfonate monooxygenase SsuD/methylene tetrahydromethanopterin reductase-like flavin-dependent oxidoreductase (luciferase family)
MAVEAVNRPSVKLGLSVYPQETSWAAMIEVVRHADGLGYDSLWTWDHLLGIGREGHQSVFEAWATVAAWAATTSHAALGLLVCANTLRNPGLIAKSAVTVNHISGGRFVLGLGSAYRELEHQAHGIDFGSSPGQRLAWLEESVDTVKKLLAGETVTSVAGGHYRFVQASHLPLPVRGPGSIPVLIPGGGESKTLRILARYGDLWHVRGTVDTLSHKIELLRGYCAEVGRSLDEIEFTTGNPVVIRDDPSDAEAVYESIVRRNGQTRGGSGIERAAGELLSGPPEVIAEAWRPYIELGFCHMIVDFPSPYDRETLERLPEVRDLVAV